MRMMLTSMEPSSPFLNRQLVDRLKWLQYYRENLGIMRLMQVKILNSMHTLTGSCKLEDYMSCAWPFYSLVEIIT